MSKELLDQHRRVAEVLGRPDLFSGEEEYEKHFAEANRFESFANDELSLGFPYLCGLASVRLWAIVEVMVEELVLDLLGQGDATATNGILARLEGPLLPFLGASAEQRAHLLLGRLKEKVGAGFQPGVARFEALLEPFHLTGPVDDAVRRVLVELWAVRNILVHRNGVADARFLANCPWFGTKLDTKVRVNLGHVHEYSLASDWYALEIDGRIDARSDDGPTEEQSRLQRKLAGALRSHLQSVE